MSQKTFDLILLVQLKHKYIKVVYKNKSLQSIHIKYVKQNKF